MTPLIAHDAGQLVPISWSPTPGRVDCPMRYSDVAYKSTSRHIRMARWGGGRKRDMSHVLRFPSRPGEFCS